MSGHSASFEQRIRHREQRLLILGRQCFHLAEPPPEPAAELLGVDQPKVSHLLRGNLRGFSVERLTRFLNALGQDVEIVVRPRPRSERHGRTHVTSRRRSAPTSALAG